jgi:hypothetical protein
MRLFPIIAALALSATRAGAEDAPNAAAGSDTPVAAAMGEDECRSIWNTAAGRSDLGPDGAKPYIDSFESVDTNRDKKISNSEFKAGCASGLVHKLRRQQ